MNEEQIFEIVKRFSRTREPLEGQIKVVRVPDFKTIYVEQIGGCGQSINLNKYTGMEIRTGQDIARIARLSS